MLISYQKNSTQLIYRAKLFLVSGTCTITLETRVRDMSGIITPNLSLDKSKNRLKTKAKNIYALISKHKAM